MQLPDLPESYHPLIQALEAESDGALLQGFQTQADQGRYFVALFCRYGLFTYTLLIHAAPERTQTDYLFGHLWRALFGHLRQLDPQSLGSDSNGRPALQAWLVRATAQWLHDQTIPPPETIRYALPALPPPLWCYLEQALTDVPPHLRTLLIWSAVQQRPAEAIAAELSQANLKLSAVQITQLLEQGYQDLLTQLPEDIRAIYLQPAAPP